MDGIQQIVRIAKYDEGLYSHILALYPNINAGTHAVGVDWHQVEVAYYDALNRLARETLPLTRYRMSYPDGHYVEASVAYHAPTDTLYYYQETPTMTTPPVDIYDHLTDLIRQHGRILSNRPLTPEEEIRVCRWLAQQVKLQWPALSMNDQIMVVADASIPQPRELPQEDSYHTMGLVFVPEWIRGGMADMDRNMRAEAGVKVDYHHNRLVIWSKFARFVDGLNVTYEDIDDANI